MSISRQIARLIQKASKSILLLGPRQTGKSTLLRAMSPDLIINLADEMTFVEFLRDPGLLRKQLRKAKSVLIDEVQRIPSILNTVQAILDEDKKIKFYLSGSSARKLKRGHANLLPGRLFSFRMGPLSPSELGDQFDIDRSLSLGLLPEPALQTNDRDAEKLLKSYSIAYLKEEIQAEALTRNLEGFSRFFEVIASRSGDFIDFVKYSSQASIERTSARRYFEILCDTLVLESVEPFTSSSKRRLIQHPRYYFFDVGVLNGTLGNFQVSADRKGPLLENLFLECMLNEARSRDHDIRVSVYRTDAGAEVDFIVETKKGLLAIEVKSSRHIGPRDLSGLKSFKSFYGKKCALIVAYLGDAEQEVDGIEILPFLEAIRRTWA